MVIRFSMNNKDELLSLILDNNSFEVTDCEVKNPIMCKDVFKGNIPINKEELTKFFVENLGKNGNIEGYINHINKFGFFTPYERNLKIKILND